MPMADERLAGLTILLVEDEPLLRKQLTAQLERLGADATSTGTLARSLIPNASSMRRGMLPWKALRVTKVTERF